MTNKEDKYLIYQYDLLEQNKNMQLYVRAHVTVSN